MKTTYEQMAKMYESSRISPLLRGAIDMHYHHYPEISLELKSRVEDIEAMTRARDSGVRAIVLKNHFWPTTSWAYYLQQIVPGILIYSSISLNISVGGPSAWVVEIAARQGAKVVWMPTWSAARSASRIGFTSFMKTWFPRITPALGIGLTVLDSSGQLLSEIKDIIKLSKELKLVISTGHLSPQESLAIAAEAERIGFEKLIMCHPVSANIAATLEEMKEMARRGAYIELDATQAISHRLIDKQLEALGEIGPEHCILSSDSFGDWPPPAPEYLRMYIGLLKLYGTVSDEAIVQMVSQNPARLLDLPL